MTRATLWDGHVHIHSCFSLSPLLDAARDNFRTAALSLGFDSGSDGVLCLTEGRDCTWFQKTRGELLAGSGEGILGPGLPWRLEPGGDDLTLTARHQDGGRLQLLAGRQIVTAEGLEVLALGLAEQLPDGSGLAATIREVQGHGALAVLPWGVGKWLGRRGRQLHEVVRLVGKSTIMLGDNGNRPWFWSLPRIFQDSDLRNLPGSDPLPLAGELRRIGTCGCAAPYPLHEASPLAALRDLYTPAREQPRCFGQTEGLQRFLVNQITIQLHKRLALSL